MAPVTRTDARWDRYWWNLTGLAVASYYLMIVVLALYAWLFFPVWAPRTASLPLILGIFLPGIPFLAVATAHVALYVRGRWTTASRFLAEGRTPTEDERKGLYALPRRAGAMGLVYWAVGLIWILPYYFYVLHYRHGATPYAEMAASFALLGLEGWSLAYLLVERALRPVVAAAMAPAGGEAPKTMSVTARLILAWATTSGVPLVGIALTVAGLGGRIGAHVRTPLYVLCGVGVLVGVLIAAFSGRVIADPIRRLRAGMRSIEQGDICVQVPVMETAELGDLEVGFNHMAAGLRERERIRDLFGRHVGTDVAQRAMTSEFALGGERCVATVLFVDVIGSTGLAQSRDPDAVVSILNRFFDTVVRVVGGEGGFVNKFQGDGALCLFGAPVPQADHAARGLRAARALASELAPMGDIAAAIGVSSGDVVAGNVGAADRYEFTVIGDAVNEASRLTDHAKLGSSRVLVSERTIREAAAENDGWIAGETLQLRGRSDATLTYEPAR
jgi:adenylate cyclase